MTVLLQLSDFKFVTGQVAYNQLSRTRQFLWAAQARFGTRPQLQYVGEGERLVTISGVIYTAAGPGYRRITQLEALAAQGRPHLLVAGTGAVLGYWIIGSIGSTESAFLRDGVPRKQEFTLELSYYGERYPDV
jgi:phage protein U